MATFSYDSEDNYVHSISQNDGGMSSVRLTVGDLAAFLETQGFVCPNTYLESAELMLMHQQKGQIINPMVTKALDWKKAEMN